MSRLNGFGYEEQTMTWENHINRYRVSMLAMTMAMGLALAGANKDAGLFIDVVYRTEPVDWVFCVLY